MKRLITLFLAFSLLFLLVACGGDFTPATDGTTNSSGSNNNTGSNKKEISFTNLVAVDNDECKITITDIKPDNFWGYELKVQLENKSVDKTYMFSVDGASINGVQCDPFFATEVAAEKKSNNSIWFYDSNLKALKDNDVGDYTDIELTFRVYDNDNWLSDAVAKETVHVYPYGEENATKFVRKTKATDNVILDNEYVTVIVTGYEDDTVWGYTANLFLLNKTSDKNIMFAADEVSVNGYMADPFFAKEVAAGKCAFSSMSWSDTTLENSNISTIEKIELTLRAYDSDNLFSDNFANENITLIP